MCRTICQNNLIFSGNTDHYNGMDNHSTDTDFSQSLATIHQDEAYSLSTVAQDMLALMDNMTLSWNNQSGNFTANTTISPRTSSLGTRQILEGYTTTMVGLYIARYKFYVLLPLTLFCNGLTLAVLCKRAKSSSSTLFMANLAVWDTLSIWLKGWGYFINRFNLSIDDVGCQVINFVLNTTAFIATWLVVVMTSERFIAVGFPLKRPSWCTVRRAKIVLASLVLIAVLLNAQYLYLIESHISPVGGFTCRYKPELQQYTSEIWNWIEMVAIFVIPQIMIFLLNIAIMTILKRASRGIVLQNQSEAKHVDSVTVMLITVSLVFFILTAPWAVFLIYSSQFWNYKSSFSAWANYIFLNTFLRLMNDLNHCINFFLYCASGTSFRRDLRKLLCRAYGHARHETSMQTTEQSRISISRDVSVSQTDVVPKRDGMEVTSL